MQVKQNSQKKMSETMRAMDVSGGAEASVCDVPKPEPVRVVVQP